MANLLRKIRLWIGIPIGAVLLVFGLALFHESSLELTLITLICGYIISDSLFLWFEDFTSSPTKPSNATIVIGILFILFLGWGLSTSIMKPMKYGADASVYAPMQQKISSHIFEIFMGAAGSLIMNMYLKRKSEKNNAIK
jgi:hypothetical protein